jgi:hypothetical protein
MRKASKRPASNTLLAHCWLGFLFDTKNAVFACITALLDVHNNINDPRLLITFGYLMLATDDMS